MLGPPFPVVHNHLHCLDHVEGEVVVLAPHGQVCLKHVGITDSDRERLNMSVKTLASWSVHALSTRPDNTSVPVALRMLTCLKVLLTSAAESVITQSSGTADALMHVSVFLSSKQA